jgi:hypothetical protein
MWKIDDEETIEATQTEHLAIDRGKTLAGSGSCLRNWIIEVNPALLELLLSKYLFSHYKKSYLAATYRESSIYNS